MAGNQWLNNYLGQLRGAKIIDTAVIDRLPVLVVTLKDGTRKELVVFCDEEGNGPGWIDGLDSPKEEKP